MSDLILFPESKEEFIENSTALEIADFVSISTKAIKNSVIKWIRRSIKGIESITIWF